MTTRRFVLLGLATAASVGIALAAGAPHSATPAPGKPCCFTNERFAGVCRVIPATGETCESIAAYLNNPSSSGRTYCDSTNLRGGWQQVDCRTGKPSEAPPATPPAARSTAPPNDGQRTKR
jgi:hypothetical protein